MLKKYGWSDSLVVEETDDGVFLRGAADRLSWEGTYRAMAAEGEDWSDLDAAVADGLDSGQRPSEMHPLRCRSC